MAASFSGVGNYKIDSIEASTNAWNLHTHPFVDTSLLNGNDIYVYPNGLRLVPEPSDP